MFLTTPESMGAQPPPWCPFRTMSGDELLPEGTSTAMLGAMPSEKFMKTVKYSAIAGGALLLLAGYFYMKQRKRA